MRAFIQNCHEVQDGLDRHPFVFVASSEYGTRVIERSCAYACLEQDQSPANSATRVEVPCGLARITGYLVVICTGVAALYPTQPELCITTASAIGDLAAGLAAFMLTDLQTDADMDGCKIAYAYPYPTNRSLSPRRALA
ncbi:uncharacterized protein G6M90_00g052710 [Metarhizium brunneum]|uniref:Uncharacterized protein n=1 Tax=Metarhizium brunneum TaxID=500148 RepID=A0A7D5Z5G0_9HYPO|nr:hypothetical protein G6M90_00g052710 [Metarhizium brunneum]